MDELTGKWLLEGHRISLKEDGKPERFFFIRKRERARYQYVWPESIAAGAESSARNITDLEPHRSDIIYQTIFGIKTGGLIYINLPIETRLGGPEKKAVADSTNRFIGHVTHDISPFENPDFETEMFLQRGGAFPYPALTLYNSTNRSLRQIIIFEVNMLQLEEIRESDTIEKLRKRQLIYRPISLGPLPPARTGKEIG